MAPHCTDELMGASKRQPASWGPPAACQTVKSMEPVQDEPCSKLNASQRRSCGSGLSQATEDKHLQQSWEGLLLLYIKNFHHVLSSKPIADSNEFELLMI